MRVAVLGILTVCVLSISSAVKAQSSDTIRSVAEQEMSDAPLPAFPNGCEPLPLVGSEGSEVTKTTSPPSLRVPLPIPVATVGIRSDWNTDWYISNPQTYEKYVVLFMPRSNADYSIEMYLKYPDGTTDRFYHHQQIHLTANEPLMVEAIPRSSLQPYQVNTNVGGLLTIGVKYTVAVAGCH